MFLSFRAYPITMLRKEEDEEIDVVKDKLIDAYTDLYLFYLMDQEIKVCRKQDTRRAMWVLLVLSPTGTICAPIWLMRL